MAYSANGTTWTAVANSTFGTFSNSNIIYGIAYGNNRFVAVGAEGEMAYSADGVTWIAVKNSVFGGKDITAIAYGDGRFVAGVSDSDEGQIAYSTDGVTWTAAADSGPFGSGQSAIKGIAATGGDKWVAVGGVWFGNEMAYSADGATWTAVTYTAFSSATYIEDIAYGGGRFVAVGRNGKIAYADW